MKQFRAGGLPAHLPVRGNIHFLLPVPATGSAGPSLISFKSNECLHRRCKKLTPSDIILAHDPAFYPALFPHLHPTQHTCLQPCQHLTGRDSPARYPQTTMATADRLGEPLRRSGMTATIIASLWATSCSQSLMNGDDNDRHYICRSVLLLRKQVLTAATISLSTSVLVTYGRPHHHRQLRNNGRRHSGRPVSDK